tara:strand:- start:710 stop:1261 length:552 start_codon:yes stop_codon:yes gene_type:complete
MSSLVIDNVVDKLLPILDSSLAVSRTYKRHLTWGSYEVSSDRERYVLRVYLAPDKHYGHNELESLFRVRDVQRTPRLIDFYEDKNRLLILKTVAPGLDLQEYLDMGGRIKPSFYASAFEVVREIHARGVFDLDIHKQNNLVVGNDGIWLFDFDNVKFHEIGSSTEKAEWDKYRDVRHLKRHFL